MEMNRGDWGGGDSVRDARCRRPSSHEVLRPEKLAIGGWSTAANMAEWAIRKRRASRPRFPARPANLISEYGIRAGPPRTMSWFYAFRM